MNRKPILLLIFLSLSMFSITFAQPITNYIPKDASVVVTFNPEHLNEKVSFEELSKLEMIKFMFEGMPQNMGMPPFMGDVMKNPSNYGIDAMSKSAIFANFLEDGNYVNMAFKISDQEKFTALVEKVLGEEEMIKDMGSFMMIDNGDNAFTWNDHIGLFTGIEMNWDDEKYPDETWEEHSQREKEATQTRIMQIMNSSPSNNIFTNARYAAANKQENDISFWVDYKEIMKLTQQMNDMGGDMYQEMIMGALSGMYEDTYLGGAMNFNDGVIDLSYDVHMNEMLKEYTKEAYKAKINKDFLNYLPADDLLGYYSFAINVENTFEGLEDIIMPMIKDIPFVGNLAGDGLELIDIIIDEDELYELFQGDLIVAVTGVEEYETTKIEYDEDFNAQEVTATEMFPEISIILSYGDEENINTLISLGEKTSTFGDQGQFYTINIPDNPIPMDVFMAKYDDMLFFTNNKDLVQNNLKSGFPAEKQLGKTHKKMMKKNVQAMYVNIPNIIDMASTLSPEMQDPMAQNLMNGMKTVFSDLTVTTNKKVKDAINSTISLNFVNEDRNSMDQLMRWANEIFLTMMGGMSMN